MKTRDPIRLLSIAVILLGISMFAASVGIIIDSWRILLLERQLDELRKP